MTSTKTRHTAAERTMQWPTLPVADLMAHVPDGTAPDPALVESIQAHGITEPLYLATVADGTIRIVDGIRRLAAAQAAALTEVPVTYRPVIRVDALSEHPGNVRKNMRLTKEFRASIREHGVRTAVLVRRTDAGLQVVDGHRRLLGAIAEKLTHIPYTYDDVSDSAAYVDMVTTAVHRESLTTGEKAAALFEAAELGASAKQLAAAAGTTQKAAKALAKAGGSKTVARLAATDMTLTELERLAHLEQVAPDLAEEIEAAIKANPDDNHSWRLNRAMDRAEARQSAAAQRAELEAKGAQFRSPSELSSKAAPLYTLKVDRNEHASCPGDIWVLESPDNHRYSRYCANAVLYQHADLSGAKKTTPDQRKRIIAGNGHWDAATTARREWLTALLGRSNHTKQLTDPMLRIGATAMLGADSIVQTKQTHPARGPLLAQFLAVPEGQASRKGLAEKASTRRAAVQMFATVAACYELYAPRTSWRTDDHHGGAEARQHTARYLAWLVELGYRPSPIETAVINGTAYDPATQSAPAPDSVEDSPATLDD